MVLKDAMKRAGTATEAPWESLKLERPATEAECESLRELTEANIRSAQENLELADEVLRMLASAIDPAPYEEYPGEAEGLRGSGLVGDARRVCDVQSKTMKVLLAILVNLRGTAHGPARTATDLHEEKSPFLAEARRARSEER